MKEYTLSAIYLFCVKLLPGGAAGGGGAAGCGRDQAALQPGPGVLHGPAPGGDLPRRPGRGLLHPQVGGGVHQLIITNTMLCRAELKRSLLQQNIIKTEEVFSCCG